MLTASTQATIALSNQIAKGIKAKVIYQDIEDANAEIDGNQRGKECKTCQSSLYCNATNSGFQSALLVVNTHLPS